MATSLVSIQWTTPPSVMAGKTVEYGKRLIEAVHLLGDYFAGVLEAYAKANAGWTDQTGAARQGLTGTAIKMATGVVIVLFHTMFYGIFLELKNSGKYAVILRTIEAHHAVIMAALRALIR